MFLEMVKLRRAQALVTDRLSFMALPLTSCVTLSSSKFLSTSENGDNNCVYLLGLHSPMDLSELPFPHVSNGETSSMGPLL